MLLNSKTVLLIVLHFSGHSCQFLNCQWISHLDCQHYTQGILCASNGQDYLNRCYLAKAQCTVQSHGLHTVGEGTCASLGFKVTKVTTAKITTRQPATITTHPITTAQPTADPLHVICDSISHVHCANDIEPVCGSDGRTYVNTCEFHIEVCQRQDLTIKHIGFC